MNISDKIKRYAAAILTVAMIVPGELQAFGPLETYIEAFASQRRSERRSTDDSADEDISTDNNANEEEGDTPPFVVKINRIEKLDRELINQELPEGEDPADYIVFPEVLEAETDDDELFEIDVEWELENEDTEPTELEPGDEYVYVASIEENYVLKSKAKLPKINVEIVENADDSKDKLQELNSIDEKVSTLSNIETNIKITVAPGENSVVYEGLKNYSLSFNFAVSFSGSDSGHAFSEGDVIEVYTNIGELFDANWDSLKDLEVHDKNGDPVAYIDVTADKFTFEVAEAAESAAWFSGNLWIPSELTAKVMGATEDEPVEKELVIGNATADITFKVLPVSTPSSSDGPVDIDTFWKNGWATSDHTGASITMEVNPIGSMDLYGSTTYTGTQNHSVDIHEGLFVKDPIPDNGFIDTATMQIYAAVPTLAVRDTDFKGNGWYDVPAGTWYAQRSGTMRYRLDLEDDEEGEDVNRRIKLLTQKEGEAIEDFEKRVRKGLFWGIYYDETENTETFMCNFGRVGDREDNNGVLYSDFEAERYCAEYPAIFGPGGASGGNIVSYYIEFVTYYPDIVGAKRVTNIPYVDMDKKGEPDERNHASYVINNGGGYGAVRKNSLRIKLVDDFDREKALKGGTFEICRIASGNSAEHIETRTTDENGIIDLINLAPGSYKIKQTVAPEGYKLDSSKFIDIPGVNYDVTDGKFTINGKESVGYTALVTNSADRYIRIEAEDITAYTGGDSMIDSAFPAPRYKVTEVSTGLDISGITIKVSTASDAESYTFANVNIEEDIFPISVFEPSFTFIKGNTDDLLAEPSKDDAAAGKYRIDLANEDEIIATDAGGSKVIIDFTPGELTVRNVSDPKGVLGTGSEGGVIDIAEPVIGDESDLSIVSRDKRAVAVIDKNASYYTNGRDELDILGVDEGDGGLISLMSDELIKASDGTDMSNLLIEKAKEEEPDYEFKDGQYQFRYLDLINEHDGNVWVSTDDGTKITIYWPYPDEIPESDREDYEFSLLHFKGLHREYGSNMASEIDKSEVEKINVIPCEAGLKFELIGNKEEGNFSPFALMWDKEDISTDDPVTPPIDPSDPGNGSENVPDPGEEKPENPGGNSGGGGGGGGGSTGGGPNAITGGTFSPRPDEDEKPEEEVSGDVSPHPEYNRLPVMGDEVFGPGFEAGTSRYETDENGTVIIRLTNDSADSSDMTKESEVSLETGSFNTESSESASNSGTLTNENSVSDTAQPEQRAIIPELSGYYAQNPDILGWLTVPGTGLGYPVMNNVSYPEYYLHHNFDKTPDEVGIPFTAPFCTADSDNILIHGHNMKNKLQFGYIWNYQYPSFRASHPAIDFKTLYDSGAGGYEVMAVFFGEVYPAEAQGVFKWYQYAGSMNKNQFDYYVQNVKAMSLYDTGVDAEYGDKLITLETCATTTDNTRLVVVARKRQ